MSIVFEESFGGDVDVFSCVWVLGNFSLLYSWGFKVIKIGIC